MNEGGGGILLPTRIEVQQPGPLRAGNRLAGLSA